MLYKLGILESAGRTGLCMEVGGRWWSVADQAYDLFGAQGASSLLHILRDWYANEPRLSRLATRLTEAGSSPMEVPVAERFQAPIQYPSKALFIGFNYYDHIAKDAKMVDFKKDEKDPFFFLKPPTTTLVGGGATVPHPRGSEKLDWEIELVAVIGRGGRNISRDRALEHVAGYMVGIDMSARDWQLNPRHPMKFDIFMGKAFDASAPVGPVFVPAAFVDSHDLAMKLWVNEELRQDSNSREMIWTLEEQIEILSKAISLEPGDLIFTGTPAGVGYPTNTFLHPGDRVAAEIAGLGRLEITIAPPVSS